MTDSKTPWTWREDDEYRIMIYDAEGNPVAQVIGEEYEAIANTICDAVNKEGEADEP